jgi:hypothetical protein
MAVFQVWGFTSVDTWTASGRIRLSYSIPTNFSWTAMPCPAAEKFPSGPGFVQLDFPVTSGLKITRTEFAPEGVPVALIGLEFQNASAQPRALVLQPISEILPAYPWSGTKPTSDDLDQADNVSFDPLISGRSFSEPGKPWYARQRKGPKIRFSFWAPQTQATSEKKRRSAEVATHDSSGLDSANLVCGRRNKHQ